MKPVMPPTSSGGLRRSPSTNAGYSMSASPSQTDSMKMSEMGRPVRSTHGFDGSVDSLLQ